MKTKFQKYLWLKTNLPIFMLKRFMLFDRNVKLCDMCDKLIIENGEKLEDKVLFFEKNNIDLCHAYALYILFVSSNENFNSKSIEEKCEIIVKNYDKYKGDFSSERF